MDSFQDMVKKARLKSGYSMRTVSKMLLEKEGVKASRTIINYLEKGTRPPTYEIAYGLSVIYEVNPEEMMAAAHLARVEHDKTREIENLKKAAAKKQVSMKEISTLIEGGDKGLKRGKGS